MNVIPSDKFHTYDQNAKMFIGWWSVIQEGDPKRQIFNKDQGQTNTSPYIAIRSVDTGVVVKFYHNPKKSVDAHTDTMPVWLCETDPDDPYIHAYGQLTAFIYVDNWK